MGTELTWRQENNRLYLTGSLDSTSLLSLWPQRASLVTGIEALNLTEITRIDTAGLALLVHLTTLGQQQNGSLVVEGLSDKIETLIQLYNLPEKLFPRFSI